MSLPAVGLSRSRVGQQTPDVPQKSCLKTGKYEKLPKADGSKLVQRHSLTPLCTPVNKPVADKTAVGCTPKLSGVDYLHQKSSGICGKTAGLSRLSLQNVCALPAETHQSKRSKGANEPLLGRTKLDKRQTPEKYSGVFVPIMHNSAKDVISISDEDELYRKCLPDQSLTNARLYRQSCPPEFISEDEKFGRLSSTKMSQRESELLLYQQALLEQMMGPTDPEDLRDLKSRTGKKSDKKISKKGKDKKRSIESPTWLPLSESGHKFEDLPSLRQTRLRISIDPDTAVPDEVQYIPTPPGCEKIPCRPISSKDTTALPGFDMYDDCGIERYSAFGALDAVSTKFPKDIRECYGDGAYELFLGVLGTSRSQTTANVLNMLGSNIPVISPFATLPELANFPNFLRTTPADNDQVQVVIQLLKDLNWTYIAALYTNDNYGSSGMEKILQLARENGICVDVVQDINSTENFANIATLENFLKVLIHQKNQAKHQTLGIVYFGQKKVIERLLIRLNQLLNKEYRGFHWIMSDFVGTSVEVFNDADDVSDGTITVSTSSVMIQEAQEFFEDKWNAALTSSNVTSPLDKLIAEYRTENPNEGIGWRNDFIMPIVDAVYVIATALKQTLFKKCRNYSTICDDFEDYLDSEFLNIMKNTTVDYGSLNYTAGPKELVDLGRQVRFDPHGNILPDRSSPLYDINIYNVTRKSFVKAGMYKNNTLSLNSSLIASHQELSSCASNCSNCTYLPAIPYKYVDGDVVLLGMFSIHDPTVEEHAFACGKFRNYTLDVIVQESFFHAIYRLRNLTGIKFGGLAFDDCYSSTVGSLIVTQFLSGTTKLPFGSTGQSIDPTKVLGVVGPYPSGVTVPLTLLFTRLKLPSVSYASSSPDLDDDINYPYFLRTVPSDVAQVEAMVKIIEDMGWKRVGMLYVNNNYGSKGKAMFMEKAVSSGICVTTPIEMSESGNQDELYQISLDIKNIGEEVIVYFGTEGRIVDLLTEMKRRVEQNSFTYDFVFLSSEDWGDSINIVSTLGSVAKGAISFKFEIKSADVGFEDYLRNRKPALESTNRWYREYWRAYFECDPEGNFDKRIGKTCSKDLQFSQQDLANFVDDQRVIHTMNAVYALGLGLSDVRDLCPRSNLYGCKYLKEQPEDVVKHIQNIDLESGSESFAVFDDEGNGDMGFTILNLQVVGQDKYDYVEVGTYKPGRLDLAKNLMKFYNSDNSEKEVTAQCGSSCKCFVSTTFTTTEATTQSPTVVPVAQYQTSTIIIIAVVSSSCLLLIILIIIVVVCFCKLRREPDNASASKPFKRYYNAPNEPSGGGISQVSKPPSDIQFVNPQGMSSDIKYMGPVSKYDGHDQKANGSKGQVNRAFSDPYLHPPVGSNSSEQMYRQQTPMSEGYDQGRMDHRRNQSPVRYKNREPVANSSPMKESSSSNYRPDLPPREEGIPNLKQYQLPNGYPRMGTSHVTNGSPTVGNSPTGSDHALLNLLASNNNVTPTDDSPVFNMSDQGSPFGEMQERDRKAQFASLKKKQKRLYNQTAMEATQSVEKISRV